ncbi:hypothetical protein [Streptomyces sp. NPDC050263]|uniref:hypothetical protein n=1 Tax=Streptomyces sp. NPDC050263 TaxID=3155037 RepID=UPI003414562E
MARSDSGMAGLGPRRLLRPGGPLYPTDGPRTVEVAAQKQPDPGPDRLTIRIRQRGGTVVWSDLMYPGLDDRPVEEVRFRLEQYLGEVERAYAALKADSPPKVLGQPSRLESTPVACPVLRALAGTSGS